jgi:antitoxin component YwqK of YwqJK toxin-antitoxin module
MKSILFSILFLFVPKLCVSQVTANIKTIYLDSLWQKTTQGNHQYYRVIKGYYSEKQETYQIQDYYKSGVLEKEGLSRNKEGDSKVGEFIFYYENGNKKAVSNFVKNRLNGKDSRWYDNGNKKQEGEYIFDEKKNESEYKVNLFWDRNGAQKVTDGTGDYEEIEENFFASGKVINGYKDGLWEGYDKKIGYTFSENYKNQKLVSGVSVDKDKISHNYKVVELKPEAKNGIMDFYNHVAKNFRRPNVERLSGKIYLTFIIDKEGKVIEPKIIQGIGYGADEEAIRVLSSYKNFNPTEIRGIKVKRTYSLPISLQSAK